MHSLLEQHARTIATEVTPAEAQLGEEPRIDPVTIITIIITIFQTIAENCPLPLAEQAKALKNPNVRQRAALLKETKESCACCAARNHAGKIYNAMLKHGKELSDFDAMALVNEAADDTNLLI